MTHAKLIFASLLLVAACGAHSEMRTSAADSCSGFDTDIERVWSGGVKARIGSASTHFGAEIGATEVNKVITKLDRTSTDWVRTRAQLCRDREANRVSAAEYATRSRCFDGWLLRMRTFVTLLESGSVKDGAALLGASKQLDDRLEACGGEQASGAIETTSRGMQAVAAASESDPPPTGPVYARSVAVVIGIDDYELLPHLRAAEADAHAVSAALQANGFELHTLLGRTATREAIVGLLGDKLPRTLSKADRVLVFFAGHGVSVGDGDNTMGYLMPWRGNREEPIASGISMTELQTWLASYAAKHVLFVADACYSGLALPHRGVAVESAGEQYMRMATRERVRFTLVAGQDNQEAWEMRDERRGAFTHFFLEALDGAADANQDAMITASEIVHYVADRTFHYVWDYYHAEQRPTSAQSGRGEFIFFSATSAQREAAHAAQP